MLFSTQPDFAHSKAGFRTVRLDWDVLMTCNLDDYLQERIVNDGRWEPHVTQVFFDVVKGGDVVVDVGANIGYFSLLASRLAGDNGRVIAFEPAFLTYCRLLEHLVLNRCRNVLPLNLALSKTNAILPLSQPIKNQQPGGGGGTLRPVEDSSQIATEAVLAAPLDNLLPLDWWKRVKLLKIDTEGWDFFVLQGMQQCLRDHAPVILMEVNAKFYEELAASPDGLSEGQTAEQMMSSLFAFVSSRGYTVFAHPTEAHPAGQGWVEVQDFASLNAVLNAPTNTERDLDLCLVPQGGSVASVKKRSDAVAAGQMAELNRAPEPRSGHSKMEASSVAAR